MGQLNVTKLTRNIIIGIAIILMVNFVFFPLSVNTEYILDTHFGFPAYEVKRIFSALGVEGRKQYLLATIFIDIPYAIVYGFTLMFIIARFSKNKTSLILLPLFISFFDLLENTGIILLLTSYPHIDNDIVVFTSVANALKWIFAIITGVTLLLLLLSKLPYFLNQTKK